MEIKKQIPNLQPKVRERLIENHTSATCEVVWIEAFSITIQHPEWNCKDTPISLRAHTVNTRVKAWTITSWMQQPLVRNPVIALEAKCAWCLRNCRAQFLTALKLLPEN